MVSKSKSKLKIIAVSVDNTSLSFDDNEPTEAQAMYKVIDEIKTESQSNETEPQYNDSIMLQPIQETKNKTTCKTKSKIG